MWAVYAVLGAVFAALTSILAKMGLQGVDSHVATAIRTCVVLVMAWGIVWITGKAHSIAEISHRGWLFLILSGAATGLSWLFFYHALKMGDASKVVPIDKLSIVLTLALAFIVLKEPFTLKTGIGAVLITAGVISLIL